MSVPKKQLDHTKPKWGSGHGAPPEKTNDLILTRSGIRNQDLFPVGPASLPRDCKANLLISGLLRNLSTAGNELEWIAALPSLPSLSSQRWRGGLKSQMSWPKNDVTASANALSQWLALAFKNIKTHNPARTVHIVCSPSFQMRMTMTRTNCPKLQLNSHDWLTPLIPPLRAFQVTSRPIVISHQINIAWCWSPMATETSTHPTRNVSYRAIGQAVIAMSRPGPAQIKPKIPKHVLCFGAPKRRLKTQTRSHMKKSLWPKSLECLCVCMRFIAPYNKRPCYAPPCSAPMFTSNQIKFGIYPPWRKWSLTPREEDGCLFSRAPYSLPITGLNFTIKNCINANPPTTQNLPQFAFKRRLVSLHKVKFAQISFML